MYLNSNSSAIDESINSSDEEEYDDEDELIEIQERKIEGLVISPPTCVVGSRTITISTSDSPFESKYVFGIKAIPTSTTTTTTSVFGSTITAPPNYVFGSGSVFAVTNTTSVFGNSSASTPPSLRGSNQNSVF